VPTTGLHKKTHASQFFARKSLAVFAVVAALGTSSFVALVPANADVVTSEETFTYTVNVDDSATVNGCVAACPTNLVIPATLAGHSVTAIKTYGFAGKDLTSVTIPNSVTTIGVGAFRSNNLTSLTLGSAVALIQEKAFENNKLTTVTIPNSVTSIGLGAFRINSLTSVTLGSSVAVIEERAFEYNKLAALVLPGSMKAIRDYAFAGNLLTSLTIPDSVTSLGSFAFSGNLLSSLTIGSGLTAIEASAFKDNNLTSLTLPETVTDIGAYAFANNNLTAITLPQSLTKVQIAAFANNNLTGITLPEKLQVVGDLAFAQNNLTSVLLAGSCPSTIGTFAFEGNTGLTAVTINYLAEGCGDTFSGVPVNRLARIGFPATAPRIRWTVPGDGQAKVAIWRPVRSVGSPITRYDYTLDDGVTWSVVDPASTNSSIIITGLTNGTRYTIRVRAFNSAGKGAVSNAGYVTPRRGADAPTITALTGLSAKIKVEFEAPVFNGGSDIKRYAYSVDGGAWHTWGAGALSTTQYIRGLKPKVTYSITLRAYTKAGWGAISSAVTAKTTR